MLALGRSGYAALGARVPLHRLLIGGSGAAAVLYVVCALAQSPLLGVLACGLTGLCVSLLWPGAIILASRRIPSAGAAMFALLSAGGDVGASLGAFCVGRAADFVLRDKPNVLTVYVDAPYDWRVEREMKRQGIGSSQAKHYIDKLDRYRESYYKYHTGRQWKRVENYDLCLDSAAIGLDNCVELIKKVIELKFDGKAK